jgi:hypothetical protein
MSVQNHALLSFPYRPSLKAFNAFESSVYKTRTETRYDSFCNWTWKDVLVIRSNGRAWLSPSVSSAAGICILSNVSGD